MNAKFRRKHPIDPYIADFCSPSIKLVIEIDDGEHKDQTEYDQYRTAYLESKGYQVLHFWNNEVMNDLDAVVIRIEEAIDKRRSID